MFIRAWSRPFGGWSRPFGAWSRSFGHGPVHSGMVPSIRWMVPLIRAWSRSFGHGPVHSGMVPFILHGPAIIEQSRFFTNLFKKFMSYALASHMDYTNHATRSKNHR
ncbi:hypothetical protein B9Z55_025997 [Caenorhabditis nigoni]|uniref:Uncharacterized protein n=1 Tax=Caenorhabditis nigoni TaxID=1611254 RepID=A0A2G5T1B7_9PELO|nr:hypothetical protein B9Z55_025997 [Caenorhabditis nigoni]